jgi:hypothetical protein
MLRDMRTPESVSHRSASARPEHRNREHSPEYDSNQPPCSFGIVCHKRNVGDQDGACRAKHDLVVATNTEIGLSREQVFSHSCIFSTFVRSLPRFGGSPSSFEISMPTEEDNQRFVSNCYAQCNETSGRH